MINCEGCGKEFVDGERVFEYTSGTYDQSRDFIITDEHMKAYCEDCDLEWGSDD